MITKYIQKKAIVFIAFFFYFFGFYSIFLSYIFSSYYEKISSPPFDRNFLHDAEYLLNEDSSNRSSTIYSRIFFPLRNDE